MSAEQFAFVRKYIKDSPNPDADIIRIIPAELLQVFYQKETGKSGNGMSVRDMWSELHYMYNPRTPAAYSSQFARYSDAELKRMFERAHDFDDSTTQQLILQYQEKAKKAPVAKKEAGCVQMTQAKYVNRPSPPYPANDAGCRGKIMKGNDGRYYESVSDRNGIYRWQLSK